MRASAAFLLLACLASCAGSARFVGVNVYSLASPPDPAKFGCGHRWSDADLDVLFGEVAGMGATVVRFSAYPSFTDGGRDFSRIDAIVAAAKKHRVRLIPVLENQWGDCTVSGHDKDAAWYRKGYRLKPSPDRPSFREYVAAFVRRYRRERTVMMWQIMNEAEARLEGEASDPAALLAFTVDLSSLIKSIDRRHPLSLGTIGGDQPGTEGGFYVLLASVPWIDVVDAHVYDGMPVPAEDVAGNCLETARQLRKTCLIGEAGIAARDDGERKARAVRMGHRLRRLRKLGAKGIIIWSYRAGDGVHMDFDARDPLYDEIRVFTRGR